MGESFVNASLAARSENMNEAVAKTKIAGMLLDNERNKQAMDQQTADKAGQVELAGALSSIASSGKWNDPAARSAIFDVGARNPSLMNTPIWMKTMDNFQKSDKAQVDADRYKTQADLAEERLKLAQEKAGAGSGSPTLKLLDEADNETAAAQAAKDAGSDSEYQRHTARAAALKDAINTHGEEETFMGYDDQNRPILKTTKGGKTTGTPTVGTESVAQQNEIKYGNALKLIGNLQKNLRPEDVGVAGLGGEMLADRGLAQLNPGWADKTRIKNREVVGVLKESLMRTITDDTRRFSNQDREDIAKALPSNGAWESYPDAMQKLNVAKGIIIDRARNYAERTGTPLPLYAQNKNEIKSGFTKKKQAIQYAASKGTITQADADAQIKQANDAALDALTNLP